jgi:uncharacterized protein YqgC (DUF456 family)
MNDIILWTVVLLIMGVGLLGSILPVIPGPPLILAAALVFGFFTDFRELTWPVIVALAGITIFTQVVDWLATVYGARRQKASRWGILGGVLGGIVGVIVGNLPGLIVGIFVVSFAAEWALGGREVRGALKVGLASLLGFLGGTLVKVLMAFTMVGVFLCAVLL